VVYQGKISAQVVRDLHRCKAWACEWLKRYNTEGIDGLKTRQKSGRPFELSKEVVYQIKKELKESNHGWTTKQAEELIVKKSGIKYHYTHIYRILCKGI
jgi:transposase